MSNLPEDVDFLAVQNWLMTNLYIVKKKGKFELTGRFHDAVKLGAKAAPPLPVPHDADLSVAMAQQDWQTTFIKFIALAQVPKTLEDNKGGMYAANKYSNDACIEFRRLVEFEKIDVDVLALSTMLYYKGNIRYKKAIGNYILQGDWKSDYEELLKAKKEGTVDKLIQNVTNGGRQTGWTVG